MIKIQNDPYQDKRKRVKFSVAEKIEHATIILRDASTGLRIYSFKKNLLPELVYYLEPSVFASKWVDNFFLEVYDLEGIQKGKHTFISKPKPYSGVVIQDKFITFPESSSDDYNTYCEVFKAQYYLSDMVKPGVGGVVVDVGANMGLASLWFQQYNPSRIIAIEPEKETMDQCKQLLQKFDNVEFVQKAIARETGTVEFSVCGDSASNQITGYLPHTIVGEEEVVEVESININDLIKEHNLDVIDYLKVDCEGGEIDLFDTIDPDYLQNNVKKIVVEFHTEEGKKFLKEKIKGFVLEKETGGGIGLLYYFNPKFVK